MNTIRFSHNWNNKLACDYFTTIRKASPEKRKYYEAQIGKEFGLELQEKFTGTVILVSVTESILSSVKPEIIATDTGMDAHTAYVLFKRFGIMPGDPVLILTFRKFVP